MSRIAILAAALALFISGCSGGADQRDGEDRPAEAEPGGPVEAAAPEAAPAGGPGPGDSASKDPPKEPEVLGRELFDESAGFSFKPVGGMKHFVDAATEGIDPETEAFMKAAGMQRRPGTVFMFYSAAPFLSLIVDWTSDPGIESPISDEKFSEMKAAYVKGLESFGMAVSGIQRTTAGGREAVQLEYRRVRKPYLAVLSAVFYGLEGGKVVTITYAADSVSFDDALRARLMKSFDSFRATGEDRKE